jgi:phosphoglycolate phosphatase-like HAD superfamily hydrolase
VNLKKPHPFSLFKSSGGLKPFTFAIYVGDSIEDALVVREAKQTDSRFLFVGVYDHSDCKDDILNVFLTSEVDAVIPSVNELPIILEKI